MQTIQAVIDKNGSVRLLESVHLTDSRLAIVTVLDIAPADGQRPYGLCAGEFVVPDDFDDPLPDFLLDAFEGK